MTITPVWSGGPKPALALRHCSVLFLGFTTQFSQAGDSSSVPRLGSVRRSAGLHSSPWDFFFCSPAPGLPPPRLLGKGRPSPPVRTPPGPAAAAREPRLAAEAALPPSPVSARGRGCRAAGINPGRSLPPSPAFLDLSSAALEAGVLSQIKAPRALIPRPGFRVGLYPAGGAVSKRGPPAPAL